MTDPLPRKHDPFYATMSRSALARLYLAVFFVFAPVMLLFVMRIEGAPTLRSILFWSAVSGLIGAGYAYSGTRDKRILFGVIPFHALAIAGLMAGVPAYFRFPITGPPSLAGLTIIALIVAGYVFFVLFIRGEGTRILRLQTELDIARRIHDNLVPPIERTLVAGAEVYARSEASSTMGGDLIDLVEHPHSGGADLFLADISGHGVRAGVLMGMVKTAIRTSLLRRAPLNEVLNELNSVVEQVKEKGMFLTLACLRLGGRDERGGQLVEYAIAGHLPILLIRADGAVVELENESLPVGVTDEPEFAVRRIACARGDLLAVFTDGLTETFDADARQLGLDAVRQLIVGGAAQPLPDLYERVMTGVRAHGEQTDDRSLLLVRIM